MLGSEVRSWGWRHVRRQAEEWPLCGQRVNIHRIRQSPRLGQSHVRGQERVTSRVREGSFVRLWMGSNQGSRRRQDITKVRGAKVKLRA